MPMRQIELTPIIKTNVFQYLYNAVKSQYSTFLLQFSCVCLSKLMLIKDN